MLDVLITISDTTPRNWVAQCKRTVEAAAKLAPFPVRVIEVPGVPGHIGHAMANGFAQTTAPYVAWVDDDDWLLPNAFACLERHFESGPAAICAREIHQLANGHLVCVDRRHHLTAYHRDAIDTGAFDDPAAPNVHLLDAVEFDAVDERSWVYVHRIRLSPAMRLRAARKSA
jgi:hypothetical protein